MNYDRLEFVESIEELATMHGLEVPYEAGSGTTQIERHQRQSLYQLMESLSAFYQQSLKGQNAKQAREYLKHRGLSEEIIQHFAIGFAPPGWDNALKRFGRDGESRTALNDAGMLVTNDTGRTYDRFRERVMFLFAINAGGSSLLAGEFWVMECRSTSTPQKQKFFIKAASYMACMKHKSIIQTQPAYSLWKVYGCGGTRTIWY